MVCSTSSRLFQQRDQLGHDLDTIISRGVDFFIESFSARLRRYDTRKWRFYSLTEILRRILNPPYERVSWRGVELVSSLQTQIIEFEYSDITQLIHQRLKVSQKRHLLVY